MKAEGFTILIIDTDAGLLACLSSLLIAEGFNVIISSDSSEAIKTAQELKPQLVIVDLLMPAPDGIDICLALRRTEELNGSLIVFNTERNEDYSQIAAFEAGADDYIIKPLKPRVLITRLRALLKRHPFFKDAAVRKQVMGLTIDRERYLIFRDDEKIVLPRKEFELLALLSSVPGKVFTRREISQLVWGYEIFSKNRTIDVHIRKLREKLGEKYIKTIKGIGYSLEV